MAVLERKGKFWVVQDAQGNEVYRSEVRPYVVEDKPAPKKRKTAAK